MTFTEIFHSEALGPRRRTPSFVILVTLWTVAMVKVVVPALNAATNDVFLEGSPNTKLGPDSSLNTQNTLHKPDAVIAVVGATAGAITVSPDEPPPLLSAPVSPTRVVRDTPATKTGTDFEDAGTTNHVAKRSTAPNERLSPIVPAVVNKRVNIVVQLSGEMGNNMLEIADGYYKKWTLEDKYGIGADIWLMHQENPKWTKGMSNAKQCFPFTRDMDFAKGNNNKSITKRAIKKNGVKDIDGLVKRMKSKSVTSGTASKVSVPFLYSGSMMTLSPHLDRYYDKIRNLFRFDLNNLHCCDKKPHPDETVFHFRNFAHELRQDKVQRLGYQELGPVQGSRELFGHLSPGSRVAIIGRYPYQDNTQRYADILRSRGLEVRLVSQSAMQDFCFLLEAEQEIVGTSKSTFFMLAAALTKSKKVHYYYASPTKSVRKKQLKKRKFHHPDLKKRFRFSVYDLDYSLDPVDTN